MKILKSELIEYIYCDICNRDITKYNTRYSFQEDIHICVGHGCYEKYTESLNPNNSSTRILLQILWGGFSKPSTYVFRNDKEANSFLAGVDIAIKYSGYKIDKDSRNE